LMNMSKKKVPLSTALVISESQLVQRIKKVLTELAQKISLCLHDRVLSDLSVDDFPGFSEENHANHCLGLLQHGEGKVPWQEA
jgi:hypothetical protein